VPEIHSALNLNLDIRIPPEYITDENQRPGHTGRPPTQPPPRPDRAERNWRIDMAQCRRRW
jgi:hypothetical protein